MLMNGIVLIQPRNTITKHRNSSHHNEYIVYTEHSGSQRAAINPNLQKLRQKPKSLAQQGNETQHRSTERKKKKNIEIESRFAYHRGRFAHNAGCGGRAEEERKRNLSTVCVF